MITAGVDVGSTHTKAAVLGDDGELLGFGIRKTGFKLNEAAREVVDMALEDAGLGPGDVAYVGSTGFGRAQVDFRDIQATDLTAQSWGTRHFFPETRTVRWMSAARP